MAFSESVCPKCDWHPQADNPNKTMEVDIGHNEQTVPEALGEFERALAKAHRQQYGQLRVIVGRRQINRALRPVLETQKRKGRLRSFMLENPGSYLLRLR